MATQVTYVGDGATVTYAIPFQYEEDGSDLHVLVGGTDVAYTLDNASTLRLVNPPPSGAEVKVFRQTAFGTRRVVFADSSILSADDLNSSAEQLFRKVEEVNDAASVIVGRAPIAPVGTGNGGLFPVLNDEGGWDLTPSGPGAPGPSANTRLTLADLRAAAITDRTSVFDGVLWNWTSGDYSAQIDDVTAVASDLASPAVGAWVRQRSAGLVAARAAIGAVVRNAQAEFDDSVKITQFGAVGGDKVKDTAAFNAAVAYAWTRGRAVCIPDCGVPFVLGKIILPANEKGLDGDTARPDKFTLCGTGSIYFDESGFLFDAPPGKYFYDLTVGGGLRFLSATGSGSKFINGDKFIRLNMAPGLNLRNFDYGIYAVSYLQTLRVIGVTHRGGAGAFIKAPMSYDCSICHNIVEFCNDGVVIDGPGDPAVHTTRIDDNVIEGISGRGIVTGACLGTSVSRNYMEGNVLGDILLNAGTVPHKGLIVQCNSLQQHHTRLSSGAYSIVWGASLALPARAGGNFCTGHLHDVTGAAGLLDTFGDVVSAGKNISTPNVGRVITTDNFTIVVKWFGRSMRMDPYSNEVVFGGKFDSQGTSPVITFGANSPSNDPSAFERTSWAKGSVVHNINATSPGDVSHWVCTGTGVPGTWRPGGIIPT